LTIKEAMKNAMIYGISLFLTKRVRQMLCHEPYFQIWERKGLHITPVHYYQPIPDTRTLSDNIWKNHSELIGIDMNVHKQVCLLDLFSSKYKSEYEAFPYSAPSVRHQFYINNGTFESVDCEVLYCMIRDFSPKIIIEIGSGNSTYLSAQALLANKQKKRSNSQLIAIEPYPNEILKTGFQGLTKLIDKKVEELDVSLFNTLQENDILFIDSSHVLKTGNDVQKIYLEILPRLNKGVLVHIHDIFFPAEYPKETILKRYRFWTEQYLLQAFLSFNNAFEVVWAGSYMHLNYPEKLENAFKSYHRDKRWPGSIWIRKII
jgi:predicted O-methyltransferase YrrM